METCLKDPLSGFELNLSYRPCAMSEPDGGARPKVKLSKSEQRKANKKFLEDVRLVYYKYSLIT